jgi:hypothetical protein
MMTNSLRTRRVTFAFLFGPPKFVSREEASRIHGSVCDALRCDDLAFRYGTSVTPATPAAKGFTVTMERTEGRGAFGLVIDNRGTGDPVRLRMDYNWPPSLEHIKQQFNLAGEAVFEALQGPWQKVLAEVRQAAQCDVRSNNGLQFIREHVLKLNAERIEDLGTLLAFASVKLEIAAAPPLDDPLANPKREITIEVLREDPRGLYLEVMSQWPQFPFPPTPQTPIDLSSARPINSPPSDYIDDAEAFLQQHVANLAAEPRSPNS